MKKEQNPGDPAALAQKLVVRLETRPPEERLMAQETYDCYLGQGVDPRIAYRIALNHALGIPSTKADTTL